MRLRYCMHVKRLMTLASLLLLAACTQPKQNAPTGQPALRALGAKVTIDQARSDESIGFEIRKRIDMAGPTDLAGVIIQVDDGQVTLRGSAPNRQAAWRAEAAAHAVAGVKSVANEIHLTTPGLK